MGRRAICHCGWWFSLFNCSLQRNDWEEKRLRKHIGGSLAKTALGPAAVLFCSISAWFLAGCSATPYTDTTAHTLNIKGNAFGGQPPISGASITLFATGGAGYGSTPTGIGSAVTDSSGNFQVTGFTPCGDPQQVYIVASGGNPGLTGSVNNTGIVLVAALGNCSSVSSSTYVIINEVTTIAAAYALSGFSNLTTTPVEIGASATNSLGLQHAFMNAANIVDTTTGTARATTPAGNGLVPSDMINTLADILEPCVNSTSKTSTACTSLFTNAKPPSVTGSATPTNTWQAALDMAMYPGNNTASLFGLVLGAPSFQPTIGSTAPNDLSIGVLYTAGFSTDGTTAAAAPLGIAADANDNVWITGVANAGLIELSSNGSLASPSAGGWGNSTLKNASTQQVAVDLKGNIWTVDNAAGGGNIYRYTPGTATTTVTTPGSVALGGIAVDQNNNIWYATKAGSGTQVFGQLAYNSGSNTFATTPTTFTGSNVIGSGGVAALTVDAKTGNVWGPSQGAGIANYFLSPYSSPVASVSTSGGSNYAAAIDQSGNTWITNTVVGTNASSIYKVAHGNPSGTPIAYSASVTSGLGLDGSRSIIIDGNNRIFVNSYAAGTIVEFDPAIGTTGGNTGSFLLTAAGNGFAPHNAAGAGNSALVANGNSTMAIDAAGALWTVNGAAGSKPVVQILGVAAPAVSVLAQGKYGVKP
jgi:hypothetical protein